MYNPEYRVGVHQKPLKGVFLMAKDFYTGTSLVWRENKKKWQGNLYWYDEDGKRHQKSRLFTSKKRESQERFDEWKYELNRKARLTNPVELVQEPNRKTVGERLREYLKYLEHEVANGNYEQSTLTCSCGAGYSWTVLQHPLCRVVRRRTCKLVQGARDYGMRQVPVRTGGITSRRRFHC